MLSNVTLERASIAYRRGYYDAFNNTWNGASVRPESFLPFASFDYKEGLLAGWNDKYWESNNSRVGTRDEQIKRRRFALAAFKRERKLDGSV